jgi:hypothetical protein
LTCKRRREADLAAAAKGNRPRCIHYQGLAEGCMFDALAKLLSDPGLLPHGYCLAWAPTLLWTLVVGNALIGLAYFSIPLTLLYFVRQHPELKFNWVFMMA